MASFFHDLEFCQKVTIFSLKDLKMFSEKVLCHMCLIYVNRNNFLALKMKIIISDLVVTLLMLFQLGQVVMLHFLPIKYCRSEVMAKDILIHATCCEWQLLAMRDH